jgi:hypothetical protein
LPGHDQPRAIGGRGFQRLPCKEHEGSFQDGENQRQKWRRHQAEFDGSRTVLLMDQPARRG